MISQIASTIQTAEVPHIIDGRVRRLTPLECERLQAFPDNYTHGIPEAHCYRCLGNAVTVSVISAIAERLMQ